MTVRKRLLGPALLLTLIATALVAACGGDSATPTIIPTSTSPSPTATTVPSAPTATTAPTAMAPDPTATMSPTMDLDVSAILTALDEMNDSGQSGWATLTGRGGDTEVVLSLPGATMSSNLVHVHSGQCGDSLGGVAHGLTNIVDGISVILAEGVSLDSILTGAFAVNAHNADDPSIYTACGNLPAREPMSESLPVIIQSPIVNAILADLTVGVGTTVTWTEEDITGHTTTSGSRGLFDGIGWDSGTLKQGDSFSYTFTEVGTFPYTCEIHPTMNATVTVTEG